MNVLPFANEETMMPEPSTELRNIALDVFNKQEEKCKEGWGDDAVAELTKKVLKKMALVSAVIKLWAKNELTDVAREINRVSKVAATGEPSIDDASEEGIWKPKKFSTEEQDAIVRSAYRRNLLDTSIPLFHGRVLLRNATKAQVQEAIQVHEQMARGNAREANYFRAIDRRMKEGQKVGDVWTNEKLGEIRVRLDKEAG